jgi:hypothetical protein
MQVVEPLLSRAGKEERAAGEGVQAEMGRETESAQLA